MPPQPQGNITRDNDGFHKFLALILSRGHMALWGGGSSGSSQITSPNEVQGPVHHFTFQPVLLPKKTWIIYRFLLALSWKSERDQTSWGWRSLGLCEIYMGFSPPQKKPKTFTTSAWGGGWRSCSSWAEGRLPMESWTHFSGVGSTLDFHERIIPQRFSRSTTPGKPTIF